MANCAKDILSNRLLYCTPEGSKNHGDEFRASLVFSSIFLRYFPLPEIMECWGNTTDISVHFGQWLELDNTLILLAFTHISTSPCAQNNWVG